MNKNNFLVFAVICLVTYIIRTIYEILKHKKILVANKTTFVVMLINMVLLWMSWFSICADDIYRFRLVSPLNYLGLILFGLGLILFLTALFTIKALESYEGDLLTKGIYSIIRHPMYLGFILWLVGLPIYYRALSASILALFFIANVLFWRHLEEIELVERFPAYKDYRKKTIF